MRSVLLWLRKNAPSLFPHNADSSGRTFNPQTEASTKLAADTEMERIKKRAGIDELPAVHWDFVVGFEDDASIVLERIFSVLILIASVDESNWPSDEQWKTLLPDWLKKRIPIMSREECEHLLASVPREKWNTLPWDFGSWLDAVRDRGWKWWGYSLEGDSATFVLAITGIPERVSPIKEIVEGAGAKIIDERY